MLLEWRSMSHGYKSVVPGEGGGAVIAMKGMHCVTVYTIYQYVKSVWVFFNPTWTIMMIFREYQKQSSRDVSRWIQGIPEKFAD